MHIYDAEMLEDDGGASLAEAQKRAQDREDPVSQDPGKRHCSLCKRMELESKGYATSAGWICASCAAEFADYSQ